MTQTKLNMLLLGLSPWRHPGEVLRDILQEEHSTKTKTEIAALLRISRQSLHNIIAGKLDISPSMALRLGKLLDDTPQFWTEMQSEIDLLRAAETMEAELKKIPTLPPPPRKRKHRP